ncbi:MAG TPA: hypothetical protein VK154_19480 [Chitinophagales bacterium]|nr:hypothetical protein [Chitinophagales bacterium]
MKYKILDHSLNRYFSFSVLVGTVSVLFVIMIFRKTIIPIWILPSIIFGVAIVSAVLGYGAFTRTYLLSKANGYIFCFLYALLSYGFLACFLFVFINYYLAGIAQPAQVFKIVGQSSMSGPKRARSQRKLLVDINYHGIKKELVFSYNDYKESQHNYFNTVSLVTKKGFLGFDVIESQKINYQNADLADGTVLKVELLSASRWAMEYVYIVDSVSYTGYDTIEFPTEKGNLFLVKYNKQEPAIHTIKID